MVRVKRLEEMLKYIETNGSVSLDELCEVFQISKNTARRDIDEVLKTGTIKKNLRRSQLYHPGDKRTAQNQLQSALR